MFVHGMDSGRTIHATLMFFTGNILSLIFTSNAQNMADATKSESSSNVNSVPRTSPHTTTLAYNSMKDIRTSLEISTSRENVAMTTEGLQNTHHTKSQPELTSVSSEHTASSTIIENNQGSMGDDISWTITILLPCAVSVVVLTLFVVGIILCLVRQRRLRYHLKTRRGRKAMFLREKEYTEEIFRESIHIDQLIFCDPSCLTDSPLQTPEVARISLCYQPLYENDSVYSLFNGFANPASCTSSDDMLDPDRISVLSSVNSVALSDSNDKS